jgi:maltose alpha-D-glucosyltransferase/alpha-amylase
MSDAKLIFEYSREGRSAHAQDVAERFRLPSVREGRLQFTSVPQNLGSEGDETVLVVNNLSSEPQSVELELATWANAQPTDLFTGERLPAITARPYGLKLAGYGYRWLRLAGKKGEGKG